MSSSADQSRVDSTVPTPGEPLALTPPRISDDRSRAVDLRKYGFVGIVSGEALAAIRRSETRAHLVVTTAAKFAFR